MPLSPPAPRRHLHTRQVQCFGYQRDDGLWDIEGRVTDTKTYRYEKLLSGAVEAGTPVHDMWIRITLDNRYKIHAIETSTEWAPFDICGDVAPNFQELVGLTIGRGWRQAIKERLGGTKGCTHLVELLGPVATVAFQTIAPGRDPDHLDGRARGERRANVSRKPYFIDGCHAWASDGPQVEREFPQFYQGPAKSAGVEG